MHLEDTEWKCLLRGDAFPIPTSFMADLLEGRIDSTPVQEMEAKGLYDQGYKRHALERLDPAVINSTLRYKGYDDLVNHLADNLTSIVHCHSCHGDYNDINYADDVIWKLGLKRNSALTTYFSGSGLCMHVASLGVAIARANGVQAEIVGHKWYYAGLYGYLHNGMIPVVIWFRERIGKPIPSYMHSFMETPYHHYAIKLTSPTGESKVIVPRGRRWWKFVKNRQFREIPDMPAVEAA